MVVDYKFPRYPNYSFLQLEEINQTLYNYARKGFDDWYCINTLKIWQRYPRILRDGSFYNLRYDFVLINCETTSTMCTWTFEIRNVFWTGNWRITDTKGNALPEDSYEVSYVDNPQGNILRVTGNKLLDFNLCIQLSPEDKVRKINHTSIMFEQAYEYSHQFDQDFYENVKVINASTKTPIANATVKLIPLDNKKKVIPTELESKTGYGYLKSYTTTTNAKGIARIKLAKTVTTGTYYARLEATSQAGNTCYTSLTDKRVQNYVPEPVIIVEEPDLSGREIKITEPLQMFKGEIKTFTIKVIPKNKYGVGYTPDKQQFTVDIYHTYDQAQNVPNVKVNKQQLKTDKYTFTTNKQGEVQCTINGRGFYGDYSYLKVVLPKTTEFEQVVTDEYTIRHNWLVINNYETLKHEIESDNGCDCVVLANKKHTRTSTEPITVNRKQYILGEKGNSYPTIDGNYYPNLFNVKAGVNATKELMNELTINGVKIIKCNNVVNQGANSNVTLTGCVFSLNKYETTGNQGNTLYQQATTSVATVDHCYFENNYGNCILARGNIIIDDNLFKITAVEYTTQPEPFVLEQYSGKGTLTNNFFYVNTSMTYKDGKRTITKYSKNRSYAKISVWVGKDATVNGKKPSQLRSDKSFNFFDAPYNNRAYIFSIYYYPYDNVKTYIVASASNSRIDRATGHAVQGTNWAWKDGYNLVRESSKNYNTNNPYVTIKKDGRIVEDARIYIPVSGGLINVPKDNYTDTARGGT